jgi:hypothetical protein
MAPSDDEIDYLLSRGKLGGSQRSRILKAALTASREGFWARWRRPFRWGAGGLVLATGAAALVLGFRAPTDGAAGFRAKGPDEAPLITLACLGAMVTACPTGARLVFALDGGHDEGGFLTAYAEPTAAGERIWLLTNEPVAAPAADSPSRVVGKAALVGEGQPPGRYRVRAVLTRRPVAREALPALAAADTLARVEVELVVSP